MARSLLRRDEETVMANAAMPWEAELDESLGGALAEVVDALGESMRQKIELTEERLLTGARRALVKSLGTLATFATLAVAWACGVTAAGLWMSDAIGGRGALLIVAGVHAALAVVLAFFVSRGDRDEHD